MRCDVIKVALVLITCTILQVQACLEPVLNTNCSTWLHKFRFPEQFSRKTMEAVAAGFICRKVRIEVIARVAVQMMQYTTTPTPEVRVNL